MISSIPTSQDLPFFTQVTTLDGISYLLSFRWNQRESCWYLSIALQDETPLADGIKIVCNVYLLRKFVDIRLPPGQLMAIANNNDTSPPGIDELGQDRRVTLLYLTVDEL